jgi:hypothetical protein
MPKVNPLLLENTKAKKTISPEHLAKLQAARKAYQDKKNAEKRESITSKGLYICDISNSKTESITTDIPKPEIEEPVKQEPEHNKAEIKQEPEETLDEKVARIIKKHIKPKKKIIIQESETSSDEEIVVRKIRKKKVHYAERTPSPLAQPMPQPVLQQTRPYNLFSQLTPFNNRGFNNFTLDSTLHGHYH